MEFGIWVSDVTLQDRQQHFGPANDNIFLTFIARTGFASVDMHPYTHRCCYLPGYLGFFFSVPTGLARMRYTTTTTTTKQNGFPGNFSEIKCEERLMRRTLVILELWPNPRFNVGGGATRDYIFGENSESTPSMPRIWSAYQR